jgi:hypothetical protein
VFADGHAFSSDTARGGVLVTDVGTGYRVTRVDVTSFDWVRDLLTRYERGQWHRRLRRRVTGTAVVSRPLFVRGLQVQGPLAWVGISPTSIRLVNWRTKEILDVYQYSQNVGVCVHWLNPLPRWPTATSSDEVVVNGGAALDPIPVATAVDWMRRTTLGGVSGNGGRVRQQDTSVLTVDCRSVSGLFDEVPQDHAAGPSVGSTRAAARR